MSTAIGTARATGEFRIVGENLSALPASPYRAALDFVHGRFWVEGDLPAAVRAYVSQAHSTLASEIGGWIVRLSQTRLAAWWNERHKARDIRFHYDRSNDFYRLFLDSRMVYSSAYFRHPNQSLDEAQEAKLDLICRKLRLQSGERFLDVGSGWGALLFHAAERYGARAEGCTLSIQQARFTEEMIRLRRLSGSVMVHQQSCHRRRRSSQRRNTSHGAWRQPAGSSAGCQ